MKLENFFAEHGIKGGLEILNPSFFYTTHVRRSTNNQNGFIRLGKTLAQLVYLLLKKKRKVNSGKRKVLIYSPNFKYDKFSSVLENTLGDSCIVLSEKNYSNKTLDPHDLTSLLYNRFKVFSIISTLKAIKNISVERNELNEYKDYYWLIASIVRRDFFLKHLFDRIEFTNFFSFHPIGDLHLLIITLYPNKFSSTYALRPTTTYHNLENAAIRTEFLIYKSLREKNIYLKNISPKIKLLEGGLILKEYRSDSGSERKAILFIDTCINALPESIHIRRKGVNDFLKFCDENNLCVYYKFHPGLQLDHQKETIDLIQSLNSNIIQIVDEIPFSKVKVAVGFDSTVFYDCIQNGVVISNLDGDYNMLAQLTSEFQDTSIITIQKDRDFKLLLEIYSDEEKRNEVIAMQREWLKNNYNYPLGMKKIISLLIK